MEDLKGIFIGYKSFQAKSGKQCNVISLVFINLDEMNNRAMYFVKDIFCEEEAYNDFVESHQLLDTIDVKREIVGDTVRYYI